MATLVGILSEEWDSFASALITRGLYFEYYFDQILLGKFNLATLVGILSEEWDSFCVALSRFVASPLNLTAGDPPRPSPLMLGRLSGILFSLPSLILGPRE